MNGEKFWKKSVNLERKHIVGQGRKTFTSIPGRSTMLRDNGVYNPIAKALEEYYSLALSKAQAHMAAQEFQDIAKEIKEANE